MIGILNLTLSKRKYSKNISFKIRVKCYLKRDLKNTVVTSFNFNPGFMNQILLLKTGPRHFNNDVREIRGQNLTKGTEKKNKSKWCEPHKASLQIAKRVV